MAKSKKKKRQARAEPTSSQSFLCSVEAYETLCCSGYTKLSQNPEIISAVNMMGGFHSKEKFIEFLALNHFFPENGNLVFLTQIHTNTHTHNQDF